MKRHPPSILDETKLPARKLTEYSSTITMAPTNETLETVEWQGRQVPVWSMRTIDYGLLLSQDPTEVEKVTKACLEDE